MDILEKKLSEHENGYGTILMPQEVSLPLSSEVISSFERVELEIGFGNGEFTVRHADENPGTLLFGMEVSKGCVQRCAKRIKGSRNICLICTDARTMMKELFTDSSLDKVYMNFPCPWPKNRHSGRRVTAREFMDDLAAVLKLGGVFELVTDEKWYSDEVLRLLGSHRALEVLSSETNPPRPVRTKYERKWLSLGKDIYRLVFVKKQDFSVSRRFWGEREMHIKTGCPLSEERLMRVINKSGSDGEARWSFRRYYKDVESGSKFLVETVLIDDDFEQHCYLKVIPRDEDTLIKLDESSQVFLTPAVRGAIEDLNRLLSSGAE